MFVEQCYQDEGNAKQQSARGTYDPAYLNYTMGKLHDPQAARRLDRDARRAKGVEGVPRRVPELWRPADPAGAQGDAGRRRQGGVLTGAGSAGLRRIGLVGFDRVNGFDLAGPIEVFANADVLAGGAYRTEVVAVTRDPIVTEAGMAIVPHVSFADAGDYDTIIVPGGDGLREPACAAIVSAWLGTRQGRTRRFASVCTGIYGLAPTGLLDGRRATTHWRFVADVQRRFPALRMQSDCIYVEDGPYFTSGGICAGLDLALALVRADLGPSLALAVGREMVVPSMRAGAQAQFSEPLRVQARAPHRLADLLAWIGENLDADLSLPALAERAAIGERQLSRLFRDGLDESPGELVTRLRMAAAREMLLADRVPIAEVARLVGYRNTDAFGRAYRRAWHRGARSDPCHVRNGRHRVIVSRRRPA